MVVGLFCVAGGAQAQTAKKPGAQEKTKLTQQINEQVRAKNLEEREKCDAKWLSNKNVKSPWHRMIVRDNQESRKISFMGIPLYLSSTSAVSGWDDENFGFINSYSSAQLKAECARSEFDFDIKMYDKTASVNDVARGFADIWTGENGELSTFDNRNPNDIMVSTKTFVPGETVGIEVFRVFETSSHKILVVDVHWHGVRTNEAALLSAFFETLKKTPKHVFESNFVTSQCKFGEESYCM